MGIPSLFKWLSGKYPKIISSVLEEIPAIVDDKEVPVDASKPNPNGLEIDNLYLDMNGIIHPCCHPEDKKAPETEEEMYIEIFKYIDRIFAMIRPRKILYMAIDGVAPRAKMNQQRSRRFRAAQEEEAKRRDEELARLQWNELDTGRELKKESNHFDSNCITPGTPFMDQLAVCLRYYIADRLNNDPGWKNVQVILSDASVPGEGEHKIMDFIRRQRVQKGYNANTKHVLYGLDADLIMLALATHEPNFWILREDVNFKNKFRACAVCGQTGHDAFQCRGQAKERVGQWDDQTKYLDLKPFIFVHISVLREYLEVEMKLLDVPFQWDIERAIDDWVFMCFFVGNDFLPHLPSLEIREGAVELLIEIWREQARNWTGYLTDSGDICLERVQDMLEKLGTVEDVTFQERRQEEERRRIARFERKQRNKDRSKPAPRPRGGPTTKNTLAMEAEQMSKLEVYPVKGDVDNKRKHEVMSARDSPRFSHRPSSKEDNMSAAKRLKMQLLSNLKPMEDKPKDAVFSLTDFAEKAPANEENSEEIQVEEDEIEGGSSVPVPMQTAAVEEDDDLDTCDSTPAIVHEKDSDEEAPADDVRLWESGWKTRYYQNKFQVDVGDEAFRRKVVKSYVEGLCWVLKYYYQGVQSWKWFFPFQYSPFASDFKNIGDLDIQFEKSQPFKPVEQLLGVFPAASRQHIPPTLQSLMTDETSPIIDFYPTEFPIDLNGKKYAWQGVALLPFIDADRLLAAVTPLYDTLTEDEKRRNSLGNELLFLSEQHSGFDNVCSIYSMVKLVKPIALDPEPSRGLFGQVFKDPTVCFPGSMYYSPLTEFGIPNIENKISISAQYYLPIMVPNYKFKAKLLSGVTIPAKVLNYEDYQSIRMGYNNQGGRGGHKGFRGAVHNSHATQRGLVLRGSITPGQRDDRYDNRNSRNDNFQRGQESGNPYGRMNNRSYDNRNDQRYDDRGNDRGNYRSNDNRDSGNDRGYSRGSDRGYDNRDRGYSRPADNRRDYQQNSRDPRERDSQQNSRDTQSYSRFQQRDAPYMGGGGYSNRDSQGRLINNQDFKDPRLSSTATNPYPTMPSYSQYSRPNSIQPLDPNPYPAMPSYSQYPRQNTNQLYPPNTALPYSMPNALRPPAPAASSNSAATVASLLAQLNGSQNQSNK